jgi:hypothetical protein
VYFGKAALTVFALSALGVYQCGAWRWLREELFNRRLARNDAKLPDAGESDTDRLSDFMRLALAQAVAAGIFLVAGPAAIVGVLLIAKLECDADLWIGILAAIAATAVMLMLAASVQSWLNQWWSKGKVQALPGAAPPAPGR